MLAARISPWMRRDPRLASKADDDIWSLCLRRLSPSVQEQKVYLQMSPKEPRKDSDSASNSSRKPLSHADFHPQDEVGTYDPDCPVCNHPWYQAVDAILYLHKRLGGEGTYKVCVHCTRSSPYPDRGPQNVGWPCPTVQSLVDTLESNFPGFYAVEHLGGSADAVWHIPGSGADVGLPPKADPWVHLADPAYISDLGHSRPLCGISPDGVLTFTHEIMDVSCPDCLEIYSKAEQKRKEADRSRGLHEDSIAHLGTCLLHYGKKNKKTCHLFTVHGICPKHGVVNH